MCVCAETPVKFTRPLEDTKCTEEDTVTLACELSKPNQKVEWFKDGKKVKPDKRTKVKAEGTIHQLTLTPSKVDDTAEYMAKVPTDSTSGKLTVEGIPGHFDYRACFHF